MFQCNLCGYGQSSGIRIEGLPLIPLYKCKQCGLIAIAESIKMPEYTRDYFKNYSEEKDYLTKQKSKALSSKQFLGLLSPSSGRLLEIGCATGFLLEQARIYGWKPEGVEISDWARKYAEDTFGFKMHKHIPYDGDYNAVVMLNTIEHLPDPKGTLEQIHNIMNSKGRLLITTPNFRITHPQYVCPEHRFYFTIKTLRRLLEKTGFEIVHLRCPYLTRKVDVGIKSIKIKKKLVGNPVTKMVYKFVKKIDNSRFGSTIEVVCKPK